MFYTTTRHGTLADLRRTSALTRWFATIARGAAANVLSALVFLLVGLLALCAGLMCLTARYDVGVLVIGGVLFISLAASNWAR